MIPQTLKFRVMRKASLVCNSLVQPPAISTDPDVATVVKRPSLKPRSRPSSRLSFVGGTSMTSNDASSEVFTPKKSNLSRQAIEKNALRRSALANSVSADYTPKHEVERPSYSEEYLAELKSSTPSTPQSRRSTTLEPKGNTILDVVSKFGQDVAIYEEQNRNSTIPTDAEIQEKKARRARLAKEQKYNVDSSASGEEDGFPDRGHDSDEDEFRNQHDSISLAPSRSKHPETRLTHDDEDILEDFDSFVDDGRITLGRKAEKEQQKKQREEMRELIEDAEDSSEDSEDSEKERREEYETTQTRKGMEGLKVGASHENKTSVIPIPSRITALPSLSFCIEKLRTNYIGLETSWQQKLAQLVDIEKERQEIAEREVELQKLLSEVSERYEQLQAEHGRNGHAVATDINLSSEQDLRINLIEDLKAH